MSRTERIVNAGRGPRFRPNRRLAAPYQYGRPWSRLDGVLIVAVLIVALLLPFVAGALAR